MKTSIQFALFLAAATTAFGQGYITWGNNMTGFRAPIYGPDPFSWLSLSGQSAIGRPPGTTVYNGPLLNGTGYTLGFLGGTSAGSLSFITSQPFRSSATGALPAGLVLGGTIIINGVAVGTTFFYQYVAWDNRGGTLTDWASAQRAWQAGTTAAGMSTIQSAVLGGVNPVDGSIVATPNAAGWTSFSIYGGGYPPYPTYFFSGFTTQPANQTVVAGATASFTVAADAYPSPSIQWYSNGAPVMGAYGGTYQITNAQPADTGTYYAVLSNPSWGVYTSAVATLSVLASPVIAQPPLGQTVILGDSVDFTVGVLGAPPLTYQWLLNGQSIAGADSSRLQLTNAQFGQSGAYRVVVSNKFGATTSAPAWLSVVPAPSYTVLHRFDRAEGMGNFTVTLSGDILYGTSVDGGAFNSGTVFRLKTDGSEFNVLRSFADGMSAEGGNPMGAVVVSGGALYGSTASGGSSSVGGTIFKMDAQTGSYSLLYQIDVREGELPNSALLVSGTTLYGTARLGGGAGYGSVFRIGTDGSAFTLLKQFSGSDGAYPVTGLALSGSSLYGGTANGGASWSGVLFAVSTNGTGYRVVKEFTGEDGSWPAGLVLSGSVLYGATGYGGSGGGGTVFRVNTDGTGYCVLKNFTTNDAGVEPGGGLVLAGNTLYGTLFQGGSSVYGALYRLNTDGSDYLVLKRFRGDSEGGLPCGGLLHSDGVLYGTTQRGGILDDGVVFALSLPVPEIPAPPATQTAELGAGAILRVRAPDDPSLRCQWFFNGTNAIAGSTNPVLCLSSVQETNVGAYSVVVSNLFGAVTSAPAMLSVIALVERRLVPALTLIGQPGSSLNLDAADGLGPDLNWSAFDSVMLTSSPQWYFDLSTPLPAQRFYRAWQTSGSSTIPTLDLHLVPALTLTGAAGNSVRVDYIDQFGPTDAWVTLGTVRLTNTSQVYLDRSAVGQPPRLWRIVPVP